MAESNEMFYLDKDGVKQDAALHADMLSSVEGNLRADWAAVDAWMNSGGKTEEEAIAIVFGPPLS
jgi:hypothetical protein